MKPRFKELQTTKHRGWVLPSRESNEIIEKVAPTAIQGILFCIFNSPIGRRLFEVVFVGTIFALFLITLPSNFSFDPGVPIPRLKAIFEMPVSTITPKIIPHTKKLIPKKEDIKESVKKLITIKDFKFRPKFGPSGPSKSDFQLPTSKDINLPVLALQKALVEPNTIKAADILNVSDHEAKLALQDRKGRGFGSDQSIFDYSNKTLENLHEIMYRILEEESDELYLKKYDDPAMNFDPLQVTKTRNTLDQIRMTVMGISDRGAFIGELGVALVVYSPDSVRVMFNDGVILSYFIRKESSEHDFRLQPRDLTKRGREFANRQEEAERLLLVLKRYRNRLLKDES